jgi:hypothetical protein
MVPVAGVLAFLLDLPIDNNPFRMAAWREYNVEPFGV